MRIIWNKFTQFNPILILLAGLLFQSCGMVAFGIICYVVFAIHIYRILFNWVRLNAILAMEAKAWSCSWDSDDER